MRRRTIFIGIVLCFVVAFSWAGIAKAHRFHTGSNVALSAKETINETVFAAGRTVDIGAEVFGDVFCAGQTVTITGTIHGDVMCAGQNVNVTGTVDGDVRLAGQTVVVGAAIAGNATIGGQSFTLNSSGSVAGDITLGSTDATLNGVVGRDVAIGGENVTLASEIGRNVKGMTTNLTLATGANIKGNVDYTSKNEVSKADGATIGGKIARTEPKESPKPKNGALFGFGFVWFLYWFAALLFASILLVLLFPRFFQEVTDQAFPAPWKALLTGFIAHLAAPVLLLILGVTVIGLPFVVILALAWFLVLLLSGPAFAFYLGRLVLRDASNVLLIMLVGSAILLVAYFIPLIGFVAVVAVMWIGVGMILLEAFRRTPRPRYTLVAGSKTKKN